jgi:hypothetical protein
MSAQCSSPLADVVKTVEVVKERMKLVLWLESVPASVLLTVLLTLLAPASPSICRRPARGCLQTARTVTESTAMAALSKINSRCEVYLSWKKCSKIFVNINQPKSGRPKGNDLKTERKGSIMDGWFVGVRSQFAALSLSESLMLGAGFRRRFGSGVVR